MAKTYWHWFRLGLIAGLIFSIGFVVVVLSLDLTFNRDPFLLGISIILSSIGIAVQVGFAGLIIYLIRTKGGHGKESIG